MNESGVTACTPNPTGGARCRGCGGRRGSIKLTAAEETRYFGHVLSDDERGYCSQRCRDLRRSVGINEPETQK